MGVDVPLALICDFYEHEAEHAPPFQGGGVMQQRERYYTPPADPFALLRTKLRSDSNASRADLDLLQLLSNMQIRWARGGAIPISDFAALERLAAGSTLDAQALLEAGRGLDFLVGDAAAVALFRAGISKAQEQYKNSLSRGPAALDLLHLLDQTKALHRLKDYPALAERFDLAMRLYPASSIEARRAGCLRAEALSKAGQAQQAADLIIRVWQEDQQAGDLDAYDRGNLSELQWRAAWYLADAERWDQAVQFCSGFVTASTDESRRKRMLGVWRNCLERLGRHDEAVALQVKYHVTPRPRTFPSTTQAAAH